MSEIKAQQMVTPELNMVTLHHIMHIPTGSNASPLVKKSLGCVPTCTTDEDVGEEVVDCNTSGTPFHMVSFFLESVELVDAPLADFPPPQQLSDLISRSGFFTKEASLESGRGPF